MNTNSKPNFTVIVIVLLCIGAFIENVEKHTRHASNASVGYSYSQPYHPYYDSVTHSNSATSQETKEFWRKMYASPTDTRSGHEMYKDDHGATTPW